MFALFQEFWCQKISTEKNNINFTWNEAVDPGKMKWGC